MNMHLPRVRALPRELHRYFWDYEPDALSWEEDRHTIVSRLLEAGGWDATRWLLEELSDDELREFLLERQGRGVDRKRLRFWQVILDLPGEEVDRWIAVRASDPWSRRTRR